MIALAGCGVRSISRSSASISQAGAAPGADRAWRPWSRRRGRAVRDPRRRIPFGRGRRRCRGRAPLRHARRASMGFSYCDGPGPNLRDEPHSASSAARLRNGQCRRVAARRSPDQHDLARHFASGEAGLQPLIDDPSCAACWSTMTNRRSSAPRCSSHEAVPVRRRAGVRYGLYGDSTRWRARRPTADEDSKAACSSSPNPCGAGAASRSMHCCCCSEAEREVPPPSERRPCPRADTCRGAEAVRPSASRIAPMISRGSCRIAEANFELRGCTFTSNSAGCISKTAQRLESGRAPTHPHRLPGAPPEQRIAQRPAVQKGNCISEFARLKVGSPANQ